MDTIQTDVSNEALVTAIRLNLCDFLRYTGRSSNPAEHFENNRFTRWHTPFPHPWFNGVLCSERPSNGIRSFIAETIRYFHDKGVNTFTWWLEPHLQASDWESVLSNHNFGFSRDTPGMAVDLHKMNGVTEKVDGLDIRVVEDQESLRRWVKVLVKGYGLPPAWESITFDLWMKLGLDLPMRNYLGYLKGEPVSTSSLFFGGGVAGIYCVSTLPKARGKGCGSALTVQPLRHAREIGYRIGVLQSSEMEYTVCKKLGGRHLCQIENYYLTVL
ncbi:MAG TPA: hypothetical protein VFZ43_01100 [Anaerolineales bacterium]